MSHILIVEDEPIIRSALRRLLERNSYQVSESGSVQETQQFDLQSFDLIISDLRLPGAPGTELIKLASDVPVLIMTSYASLRSAVDSMKLGAIDYIAKPFDHQDMLQSIKKILEEKGKPKPATTTAAAVAQPVEMGIIGNSPAMLSLFDKIRKVAPSTSNVLIQGESGTGKELVARALHQLSERAQAPMISLNCAAIPESLIESELFGHEKGAFTGAERARTGLIEAADGGTLFLDEIGELPLEAQARLLRVLQEGEIRRVGAIESKQVNVRLLAATHRDLKALVQSGQFREDLFYRLNVIALHLPALRKRGDDIITIANSMLQQHCQRLGTQLSFNSQALEMLAQYHWPGNVRELENAVERAVILCDGQKITRELLGIELENAKPASTSNTAAPEQDSSIESYFLRFVQENQDHMTETELASNLGISRKSLWERRQRLGIPRSAKR